jgi:hypothetical protein
VLVRDSASDGAKLSSKRQINALLTSIVTPSVEWPAWSEEDLETIFDADNLNVSPLPLTHLIWTIINNLHRATQSPMTHIAHAVSGRNPLDAIQQAVDETSAVCQSIFIGYRAIVSHPRFSTERTRFGPPRSGILITNLGILAAEIADTLISCHWALCHLRAKTAKQDGIDKLREEVKTMLKRAIKVELIMDVAFLVRSLPYFVFRMTPES